MKDADVSLRVANTGGSPSSNRNWRAIELVASGSRPAIKAVALLSEIYNLGSLPITSKKNLLSKLELTELDDNGIGETTMPVEALEVITWAAKTVTKFDDYIYPELLRMFNEKDQKPSATPAEKPASKPRTPKAKAEPIVASETIEVILSEHIKDLNQFRKLIPCGQQIKVGEVIATVLSNKAVPGSAVIYKGAKGQQKYWAVVEGELKVLLVDIPVESAASVTFLSPSEVDEKHSLAAKKRFAASLKQE